jgi:hypothetical protein
MEVEQTDSRERKMHEFYVDLFKNIKGFSVYNVQMLDYF